MENLLPVGSVVLLNGGKKRLLIIGILQTNPADDKQYDYLACLYPEGFVGAEHTYLFNHADIDRVDCEGFADEEHTAFRAKLTELLRAAEAKNQTEDTGS